MWTRLLLYVSQSLKMELLQQVTNIQFLYAAAAVTVVLICAALVFVFGFHSAEQPQFDKLPLVVDDKKSSSKKKKKDKKSSPNRNSSEDAKAKSEIKKSPSKEKREEKVKESEKKAEKKEKVVEPKAKTVTALTEVKRGKKGKIIDVTKPDDFDDGEWKEVPKKSEKKKAKSGDEKESPVRKNKKKTKDSDVEAARPMEERKERNVVIDKKADESPVKVVMSGPGFDEEAARALQAQVEELQRVLKAAELRDQGILVEEEESLATGELPEVKDLRSNKKQENKEKQNKKKANDASIAAKNAVKADVERDSDSSEKQDEKKNLPAFDELGDTWTEAKAPKKSKKKARKE